GSDRHCASVGEPVSCGTLGQLHLASPGQAEPPRRREWRESEWPARPAPPLDEPAEEHVPMQRRRLPVVVVTALVALLATLAGACGGHAEGGLPGGGAPPVGAVTATGGTGTVLQAIDAASLDPTAM